MRGKVFFNVSLARSGDRVVIKGPDGPAVPPCLPPQIPPCGAPGVVSSSTGLRELALRRAGGWRWRQNWKSPHPHACDGSVLDPAMLIPAR